MPPGTEGGKLGRTRTESAHASGVDLPRVRGRLGLSICVLECTCVCLCACVRVLSCRVPTSHARADWGVAGGRRAAGGVLRGGGRGEGAVGGEKGRGRIGSRMMQSGHEKRRRQREHRKNRARRRATGGEENIDCQGSDLSGGRVRMCMHTCMCAYAAAGVSHRP